MIQGLSESPVVPYLDSTMSKSKAFSEQVRAFGWPPIMPMRMATAYSSVSKWTIKRAVVRGEFAAAGRRGRDLMFRREDLDRWLLGQHAAAGNSQPLPSASRNVPRSSGASSETDAALTRLRAMRGHGR